MAKAKRYAHVIRLVEETKPEHIIEIGVWNGDRAIEMARAALKHSKKVHYEGFDLFETATDETDKEELNAKPHCSLDAVTVKLNNFAAAHPGFSFDLHRGNTRETLKAQKCDFAYIDGGHSVETIRSDYEALRESPMIVFDDYYEGPNLGWNLDEFGANRIVDDLPGMEVINTGDPLKGGGVVCLAVVRNGMG